MNRWAWIKTSLAITDYWKPHARCKVSESSCHTEIKLFSYDFLLRWAAVRITNRNTCQFTFIYICECGFAFRFNLFGTGRWQASRLTYNNPSSSCSAQSQSTGTHKPETSLHEQHRKHWNLATSQHIDYIKMTIKILHWWCLLLTDLLHCYCSVYIIKFQAIRVILINYIKWMLIFLIREKKKLKARLKSGVLKD